MDTAAKQGAENQSCTCFSLLYKQHNRAVILRVAVVSFLLSGAVILGVTSYFVLAGYETHQAHTSFRHESAYALTALQENLAAKENGVLSMAKNMAYLQPEAKNWPNVTMPGFYDSNAALKLTASFSEIMFMPLVLPEQLAGFEKFLRDYLVRDHNVPINSSNVDRTYFGIFSINSTSGYYHDTTGVTLTYQSPYTIATPIAQFFFSEYFGPSNFGFNLHSLAGYGRALDAIIECSSMITYAAAGSCVKAGSVVKLPLGAPDAEVEHVHSIILQPIYLASNTSLLVGFMGGGFDWLELLTSLHITSKSGISVVIEDGNTMSSFVTEEGGGLSFLGVGPHRSRHSDQDVVVPLFVGGYQNMDVPAYFIRMYPTDTYINHFVTPTPIIVGVVLAVFMFLCVCVFLAYDKLMQKALEADAAALETKRRFVRFISHEIRTPLNAVHLGLEALTSEVGKMVGHMLDPAHLAGPTELIEALRSWLELSSEMMGNSESAVDVLNDLLNYDKIEMGTLRLEFSSVPISNLMDNVMVSFLTPAKQKNIRITLENSVTPLDGLEEEGGNVFVVVGDSGRLAQVMRNLISNAIKFTPNGGAISIQVERVEGGLPNPSLVVPAENEELLAQPRAGSVRISVTDSGVGLSEEQLAKICSEGVQFNANELQAGKGSGLGLFITKGIVEQHGGKLTVTSPGLRAGTTFTIDLPLFHLTSKHAVVPSAVSSVSSRAVSDASATHISPSFAANSESPLSHISTPMRILVVDDASSNRKMLIRILTSDGYVCEQAEDGQQALDCYVAALKNNIHFDAIIMDFEMPVMNGPSATKKLREMGCRVPVLGVTGNLLPEDIKYFKEHGANQVFGKPLNLVRFEEFLHESDVSRHSDTSHFSFHGLSAQQQVHSKLDTEETIGNVDKL